MPAGQRPRQVRRRVPQPVDPLVTTPAGTADPRGLGYSDALTGTIDAMYSPSLWPDLTKGLNELHKGRGDTLLKLADEYMERDEDGHYNNSSDAETAINCVDQPPVTDRQKVIEEDRRTREVAPFMSYGQFTGNAPLDTCAFWPVPATSTPTGRRVPASVLVVSTTHDPATPYQAGVDLAAESRRRAADVRGHPPPVVFEQDACVDGYATRYLIDLTLPPKARSAEYGCRAELFSAHDSDSISDFGIFGISLVMRCMVPRNDGSSSGGRSALLFRTATEIARCGSAQASMLVNPRCPKAYWVSSP